MAELRAIRGARPEALAQARIVQCTCGSRTVREVRIGIAKDKNGRVIHRGTPALKCDDCGKLIE